MPSEQGIQYKSLDALSAGIANALACDAILDGEIVHLDADENRSLTTSCALIETFA